MGMSEIPGQPLGFASAGVIWEVYKLPLTERAIRPHCWHPPCTARDARPATLILARYTSYQCLLQRTMHPVRWLRLRHEEVRPGQNTDKYISFQLRNKHVEFEPQLNELKIR